MRLGRLSKFEWDVAAGRIDFDRQMARNLGFAPDEMPSSIGDTFEWVYKDDQDEVRQRPESVLRGDEDEYELYVRVAGAEREWRWQLSRGRVVEWDDEGRATRIIGFQQDVHERVESEMSRAELEEKLRQSKKMEALGRLAGGIAHDFNNLLTAITGYADLVYHQLEDPELREDVREITVASARAERLTSRLLSLSRRQSVRSTVVDLNAMIREYEEMVRRLIGGDIEVDVDLADSVWPVEIDRGALEQIVLNLVVNARDAMPDGGRLAISTDRYELPPQRAARFPDLTVGDYVRLTVEDSGVGMDEQTRERALEPFFTTKDVGEGTGLGLATVYGAVRQAGGSVTIDSEPGEGTRIEILLPRSHRELSEFDSAEPRDIDVDAAGETILVAEDDPVLLNLVQRVLADRKFQVIAFEDAREALAWLDDPETSLDLLLTDVVMPGAKGTELAERAQERFPGMNILFMSGYTADAEFSAWKETEGVELIRKPFTPASLVERVLGLLANHR
jgi:signal transduction histidine kinase